MEGEDFPAPRTGSPPSLEFPILPPGNSPVSWPGKFLGREVVGAGLGLSPGMEQVEGLGAARAVPPEKTVQS